MSKLANYTYTTLLVIGLVLASMDTASGQSSTYCGRRNRRCSDDFDCCRRYTCQWVKFNVKKCMDESSESESEPEPEPEPESDSYEFE